MRSFLQPEASAAAPLSQVQAPRQPLGPLVTYVPVGLQREVVDGGAGRLAIADLPHGAQHIKLRHTADAVDYDGCWAQPLGWALVGWQLCYFCRLDGGWGGEGGEYS